MKITNDDLYKWFELKGIKPRVRIKIDKRIYEVYKLDDYLLIKDYFNIHPITFIIGKEFEFLPPKKCVGDLDINDKDNFYNYGLSVLLDYKSNLCDFPKDIETIYQFLEYWRFYNGNLKTEHTDKIYAILKELCDKEIEVEE